VADKQPSFKRKQIYINMDLQFKYSLILVFTMFVEMIIIGIAVLYIFSQPKPEVPGANIYFIYRVVLAIIIFLTLCNITVGVYLSHKVAGPLFRFIMCAKEIGNGNFRIQANLRRGDELRELETALNEMTENLRLTVRNERQILDNIRASIELIKTEVGKGAKLDKDQVLKELNFISESSQKVTSTYTI
jgi:nitrogen fixation/metabolism regulation signal transduction histidine kinase